MATLYYRPQALETIARLKNFMGEEKNFPKALSFLSAVSSL